MSFAYMPLFTGDYLRDTRHLTPLKHGIYILLLMHCWDQKGPVPLDEQEAAGIANCRSADEIDALRYVLDRYFTRMEDGHYNKRMSEILAHSEQLASFRRAGGLERARRMRDRVREAASSTKALLKLSSSSAQAMHEQVSPSPSPSPSSSPSPVKAKTKTVGAFAPPGWVPQPEWDDFDAMRKAQSGKAWTPRAKELAILTLEKLVGQGNDAGAVLRQSVERSWKGLFHVERPTKGKRTAADARREVAEAIFGSKSNDDITGTAERVD